MKYNHIKTDDGESLFLIYSDGQTAVVGNNHANFSRLKEYVLVTEEHDEELVRELADAGLSIGTTLRNFSERVSYAHGNLYFDGDIIDGSIAQHIVRMVRNKDDQYMNLVRFLENVSTNPSKQSAESLYSWLADRNFTITPEGNFLAYKGVAVGSKGESQSIHTGFALVNGVAHKGHIPNPIGGVITMPRSQVNADTSHGCSTGLHAGTWEYAHGFARGRTLVVSINPRDVVSVPKDCNFQKLRVSRYVVMEAKDQPYHETSWDYDKEDLY